MRRPSARRWQAECPDRGVEDIVTEHECYGVVANKVGAQNKCLCQTIRGGLHLVFEINTETGAVTEQSLELLLVGRSGNNQNIADTRQHESGQRVVNHRLVIDRSELLANTLSDRVQTASGTAGKNNSLHNFLLCHVYLFVEA